MRPVISPLGMLEGLSSTVSDIQLPRRSGPPGVWRRNDGPTRIRENN